MGNRAASTGFEGQREIASTVRASSSGTRAAAPGGMPFDPPNCQGRTKNDTPCMAKRARGTMFCVGHLRQRGELDSN